MNPHVSFITLGVRDLPRAKRFYSEGLGWPVEQDYPQWVSFAMGPGSSIIGLYPWEAAAADAGVPAEGSGFPGFTLAHNVRSEAEVDALLDGVARAGGRIVKPAERKDWGGYGGYFADPDGFLWEVAWNPHFPHV